MRSLTISKLLGAAACLTWIPLGTAHAQEEGEQDRFTIMLGGSYTGAGDLEYAGAAFGEVETTRYRLEASYTIPLNESWMFEVGGEYSYTQMDHSLDAALIPEDLSKIALNLGAVWRFNEKWMFRANLSPGFYGDDNVDFSDAFNAPLMLLGMWQKSESVSISAGLVVDTLSEIPVLPVLGVNWKINPEWELSLGAPRTELRYQHNEHLALFTGLSMQGDTYAVDIPTAVDYLGRPLTDTVVSQNEFRAVLGFDYKFDSGLKLSVEGGYAFQRELDYHERDVKLEADSAPFGGLSVSYSF